MSRSSSVLLLLVSACTTSPAPAIVAPPTDAPPVTAAEGTRPLVITRVGHASVLLDFDGEVVLTDPWFTESSQYHHGEPLGVALAALPHLTAVVVSHDHYDHFDIEAFAAYPDKQVPFLVAPACAAAARRAGFRDVRELQPWQRERAGSLTITAAPGQHSVPEITFVLEGGGNTVYFGADTLRVHALDELARRFPRVDVALLPVNGLHAVAQPVVMNAEQAAELAGTLRARVAVPIHYAFRGGWFTDGFILRYDGTPDRFVAAARRLAPATEVRVLPPGQRLTLRPHP